MDWLRYSNQGAIRNQPINPRLAQALGQFLPEMGLTMEVFSGGQPGKGTSKRRVGSVRHDHGKAADAFFYKDGRRLDWSRPDDVPLFQELVRRGRAAGITGFGAGDGYMQRGSMHIGFGSPGVWGAGGRGSNAPGWLAEAFAGAPPGSTPTTAVAMAPAAPASPAIASAAPTAAPVAPTYANPEMAGAANNPNMLLGNFAMSFLQNQQARQEQRRAEEEAEQVRRQALLGSMFA